METWLLKHWCSEEWLESLKGMEWLVGRVLMEGLPWKVEGIR